MQNFQREEGDFGDLRLDGETTLMERLEHYGAQGSATLAPHLNLRFLWFRGDATAGTEWHYADSDGFVCAIGTNPTLVSLTDRDYHVRRTGESGQDWSDEWALTAFQANLLFEGVWNSAFDPAVFLLTDLERKDRVEGAFTFGRLTQAIVVEHELRWDVTEDRPLPWQIRATLLDRAMRSFRNDHLLPLKWNIEAARRRLFAETMTLLHRQENLHQFAITYDERQPGQTALSRDMLFNNTSEAQLRGYVSLISAKMPLLDNLTYLAQDAAENILAEARPQDPANGWDPRPRQAIGHPDGLRSHRRRGQTPDNGSTAQPNLPDPTVTRQIVELWSSLAKALGNNVSALENSFESAWRDGILHETEQVRVEEEALGELQREASQETEGRWFDTLLLVITLAVTMAVLLDAVSKGGGGQGPGNGPEPAPSGFAQLASNHQLRLTLAVIVGISLFAYLFSLGVRRVVHGFVPRYEQVTRLDEPIIQAQPAAPPVAPDSNSHQPQPNGNEPNGARSAADKAVEPPVIKSRWKTSEIAVPGFRASHGLWHLGVYRITGDALKAFGVDDVHNIGFAALSRAEVQRARVDTPSDADSFLRLHLEFSFLLSRSRAHRFLWFKRRRRGLRLLPLYYRLTGWLYYLQANWSRTFPLRRADVQCAIEFHKHWPDPNAAAMLFIREVRTIVVSRERVTLNESAALLHFVDAVTLQQLLPWYKNRQQAAFLAALGQQPHPVNDELPARDPTASTAETDSGTVAVQPQPPAPRNNSEPAKFVQGAADMSQDQQNSPESRSRPPEPGRDRPVRLSLLVDRIFAFNSHEEVTLVNQPVDDHATDAAHGSDAQIHIGEEVAPSSHTEADHAAAVVSPMEH